MSELEWMPPMPADVEYEGVIRFLAPAGRTSKMSIQLDKAEDDDIPSVNFSYANNTCKVTVEDRYDQPDDKAVSVVCEKPEVRFRIISFKDKISVWVNDKQLLDAQDVSKQMKTHRKNGMRHLTLYGTNVGISDLRLRAPDATALKK